MIIAIRRDIENGESDDTLQKWRKILLCTTMSFKIIENEKDFHFTHLQTRENAGSDFVIMRHSAVQCIIDIAGFTSREEKLLSKCLSAKDIANNNQT